MQIKEIYPNLFLYSFPNQYELTSTFIRLQEFYESQYKEIKGQFFTVEKYMDRYTKDQKDNKFTYFEDWNGFNIPGNIMNRFYHIFGSDMSKKEYDIFDALGHMGNEKYYVIGVVDKDDDNTIEHEVAHALYYLNKDYRKEISKLIKNMPIPLRSQAEKHLKSIGYCKTVIKDELQAYFATGLDKQMIPIWCRVIYCRYIKQIKRLFKIYGIFAVLNAKDKEYA